MLNMIKMFNIEKLVKIIMSKKGLVIIALLMCLYLTVNYLQKNSLIEGIKGNKNAKESKSSGSNEPVPQYASAGKEGNDIILKAAEMESQAVENTSADPKK